MEGGPTLEIILGDLLIDRDHASKFQALVLSFLRDLGFELLTRLITNTS
jgi:hypothetical protein